MKTSWRRRLYFVPMIVFITMIILSQVTRTVNVDISIIFWTSAGIAIGIRLMNFFLRRKEEGREWITVSTKDVEGLRQAFIAEGEGAFDDPSPQKQSVPSPKETFTVSGNRASKKKARKLADLGGFCEAEISLRNQLGDKFKLPRKVHLN